MFYPTSLGISNTAEIAEQIQDKAENTGNKKVQKSPLVPNKVLQSLDDTKHTFKRHLL